jgi:hypothetical protein
MIAGRVLACIIHEQFHESIFSFSCVDSKDIFTSRMRFSGALMVKELQTGFSGAGHDFRSSVLLG